MTRKYPKVGERVAFVYHGKPRVGTVEAKNRKYMTLEHFDTKTGREYSCFLFHKVEGRDSSASGITIL